MSATNGTTIAAAREGSRAGTAIAVRERASSAGAACSGAGGGSMSLEACISRMSCAMSGVRPVMRVCPNTQLMNAGARTGGA